MSNTIFGIAAMVLFGIWIILRLSKSSTDNSKDDRSIEDMLRSIEGKLDQQINNQKTPKENNCKKAEDGST